MKIVFAGSPEFAVPVLENLLVEGKEVVAVVTQPDKPAGRKRVLTPTPVKVCAERHGLTVYDFEKIRNHVGELKALHADIMITCAYGQILTQEVLNCFPRGVWNMHASLLPKFRGASPVQSAILAGESHTGITVMKTELALDSGDILLVKRCEIGDMTCGELEKVLSRKAAEAAVEATELLESGQTQLLLQDEAKVTYCKKINKADARLNFAQPAQQLARIVRAMSPQPLAYCLQKDATLNVVYAQPSAEAAEGKIGEVIALNPKGRNLRGECTGCFTVKCGEGALDIFAVQPAGGKAMSARDFINGRKIKAGDILD